ncbi:hypothetical protein [Seonamhaeicola maritimus]|uniref:Esterase n=1 Tax=Seonamhaeicola maritimus TaxID=2591822 RepID=A0A5C7GLA9_9FLAO|nr:hypothetical protein [Seonamhaeicola maritimus]TXG39299.1 hypothetical protein FUA22_05335 [Seonamhaeicola maritimus]
MKRQKLLLVIGFSITVLAILSFSKSNQEDNTIETFSFSSNGENIKAKIYLPDTYKTNNNLPAIFLIDFTEQHFKLVTDEFEQVLKAVKQLNGTDALVVSLANIPDVDATPDKFQEYYTIYKDLVHYVDGKYTNNTSRTFIGKGSEGGIVVMALLTEDTENTLFDNFIATDPSGKYADALANMIEADSFPKNKTNKKLHFSFTPSNNYKKCSKLIGLINEANYPWLTFYSTYYKNNTYDNAYPMVFSEGIKFVFED